MSGETIQLKVIAAARQNRVERLAEGVYKVWTTAVPEKGKANVAVIKQLAEALDLPKSEIHLIKGAGSSHKLIVVGDHESKS